MLKKQHFNKPQLRSMQIAAPFELAVMGRGTGKTIGILAPKSAQQYFGTMPRSTGTIINATFTQAYTRTLKELVRGWQMLGYEMDHHFIVGKRPSEKWIKQWKWKGPYAYPMDFKHVICWFNGAVAQLISQDRPGSTNGMSIDWGIADEIKLLNYERLASEWFPANRGIIPEFANNPYHHGWTFTTDMPIGNNGRWIFDLAAKMDKDKVNELWQVITLQYELKMKYKTAKGNLKTQLASQIDVINDELNDLRKGMLYYHEASTLDNIDALGIEYIKQQLRDTSTFLFDTQILNLRPMRLEDGFYPDFEEEYHGYFAENSSYFDTNEIDYNNPTFDSRKDSDVDINEALHISMDYNRSIHPMVIAQLNNNEVKILNGIHTLYPEKLRECVKKFIAYYKHHKKKVVYYWYDHTAVGEQHETRICDDVIGLLGNGGWTVIRMYIGNTGIDGNHEARYRMYGSLFKEDRKYKHKFKVNRENCKHLILSLQLAETDKKKDGYGKNKKSEHDGKTPAEEATHYSEALDIITYGMLETKLRYKIGESVTTGGIIIG
jgi:hypothetical protein